MLWLSNLGWFDAKVIYVLLDDLTYTRHDDTFDPNADPSSGNYLPPTGLYEPVDTLGKVWRTSPGLKDRLGFATEPEVMINTKMQMFEYGEMIHIPPTDVVFVFKRGVSNTWSVHDAAGTD